MATAFILGSPLQGMFEYAVFVFSTASISVAFSLLFFAFALTVLGPDDAEGRFTIALRPAAIAHIVRRNTVQAIQPPDSETKVTAVSV